MNFVKFSLLLSLAFVPAFSTAAPYFKHTRTDTALPVHCVPMQFSYFTEIETNGENIEEIIEALEDNQQLITVGIEGAHQKGFTHEYAMKRSDATPVWQFLKSGLKESKNIQSLKAASHPCEKNTQTQWVVNDFREANKEALRLEEMSLQLQTMLPSVLAGGFSFVNEGDILEVLSPLAASKDDPETEANESMTLIEEYPTPEYVISGGMEYHRDNGATVGELDVVVIRTHDCSVVAIGETKLGLRSLSKARSQLQRFVSFLWELRNN